MRNIVLILFALLTLGACKENTVSKKNGSDFTVEAWADNWFEMYVDGVKVLEDSVPITTERSFNSEIKGFDTNLPAQIAFVIKDFKQNDTGLEYIGTNRQQMGDGGFIAQIKDSNTGEIVAVTNEKLKCFVVHHAPINKSCADENNPVAGEGACGFEKKPEPTGWKEANFDDSSWSNAKVYTEQEVRPKDGYDDISWDKSAKLIWADDLQQDNTILCRMTMGNKNLDEANNININQDFDRCAAVKESIKDAGFADSVDVSCDNDNAYLKSDTYPNHSLMNGIVNTNEQIPVPANDYSAPVSLQPELTNSPVTRDSSLAVAVNGVPIFDYTGGGEMSIEELYHHQTQHDTILTEQLDECGGHAGRGDDYHYHKTPNCMVDQMDNAGDDAIIGWAFDGFPIYGDKNPDGSEIKAGTLDVCNGQVDEKYGYRYHTSKEAPYIIQCLMGKVMDIKEFPRVPPLKAIKGQPPKTTGKPPRGGVDNLKFVETKDGKRSLTYSYKEQDYYIRYEPSNTPNCYYFETHLVTDALAKTGEYCR